MLIALIQPNIRWQDCKGNLAALEGLLDRARGADLSFPKCSPMASSHSPKA